MRGLLLACLVPLALLAATPAASAAGPGEAPVAKRLDHSRAQVRGYWTPKRMEAARPVARLVDGVRERVLGGTRPTTQASHRAAQVGNSRARPARTHGKVFFTIPGRGDFVCSATVVRSGGRSLVLTAGHCVYDDVARRFASRWMFVPAYRNGARPFGGWVARRLATTSQFRSTANLRFDVGVAVVRRNGNGRAVQDRVGGRGIAFSKRRDLRYRAFGYPAQGRFDGERLYRCNSRLARSDDPPGRGPRTIGIDCDMTGGASGGGWVVGKGVLASITSYAYECTANLPLLPCSNPDAERLFGPYFGSAIRGLYRANRGRARRCGGRVVTHQGARRHDRLSGTRGADAILGRAGRDLLRGRAGSDAICAGPGHDRVIAGPGSDRILARSGGNRIRCGSGRDVVVTNRRSRANPGCEVVVRR